MSSTEIYYFDKNGTSHFLGETSNAWLGAMAIWNNLEKKYLPTLEYPRFITCNMEEIWDLAQNPKVSETDKICLISTFDKAIVKKRNLSKLFQAFNAFSEQNTTNLKHQVKLIEEFIKKNDIRAIGWNQTSVNYEPFKGYNIYKKKDHFEVFEYLDEINKKNKKNKK